MHRLATLTALTLTILLTATPALAQSARFEGLGFLPGGQGSAVGDISADGTTVVGYADAQGTIEAFRWQAGEMEGLGFLPGGISSFAFGVSGDGSVVVGRARHEDGGQKAVRWVDGEMELLEQPSPCSLSDRGAYTWALEVSSDGSIIVGRCGYSPTSGFFPSLPIRWVDGEADIFIPGNDYGAAYAISSDGSTIGGYVASTTGDLTYFRWTEEGGVEELVGFGPNGGVGIWDVSADGSVLVRTSSSSAGRQGWRWENGVAELLPVDQIPNANGSFQVNDVSGDGSIIVGSVQVLVLGGVEVRAAIWVQEEDGWRVRELQEVLENDYGLDLSDWDLTFALGISDDGTVIAGSGYDANGTLQGYRVQAPFGQPVADEATPETLADVLSAPSPNPIRGRSTFTLAVEHGQNVSVEVFDALGRHVQTVYAGALASGMSETLTLDASALPAGVYVVRATGEDFVKSRRVTVVR